MNKAPAFLMYAGDLLSSPDVQSMDTREVGAYVLLLLNAWQGDLPGHLLNNEARIRRITRMSVSEWEVSRELLLSKFPVADMGHTRYNPRMVAEAESDFWHLINTDPSCRVYTYEYLANGIHFKSWYSYGQVAIDNNARVHPPTVKTITGMAKHLRDTLPGGY